MQASQEEVTIVWGQGLTGRALNLGEDAEPHHVLGTPRHLSDFYSMADYEIGHGAFGTCLPGSHKMCGHECIVKLVRKDKVGAAYLDHFERPEKFSVLLAMVAEPHPNVVQYLDFLIGPSLVIVAMESLRGPELFEHLVGGALVTEHFCREAMRQILSGIAHCHRWGVIHRDVKLENFRFRHADDCLQGLALLDFGLWCPAEPQEKRPVVGTCTYAAPEMYSGSYNTPIDIWSAGVILFVMLTGNFPFNHDGTEAPHAEIFSDERLDAVLGELDQETLPPQAVDLIKSLLLLDPARRLTAADALNHSWFKAASVETQEICVGATCRKYGAARQTSEMSPKLHQGMQLARQLSDLERTATSKISRTNVRACACMAGSLQTGDAPRRIIFLDIDGVLAPSVNAGQIVKQCVDGVVALCRLADARIVLTSSWRLLEDKVDMLDDLLKKLHGAQPIYDVTPDMYSISEQVSAIDLPEFPSGKFVHIDDRRGLSLDTAMAAAAVLGVNGEHSQTVLAPVFNDPNYDLHVFSEMTREYRQECFSPRSRSGADMVHQPCSPEFGQTRCREVLLWLHYAALAGVAIESWAVLDDDNLISKEAPRALPSISRQRTGPLQYEVVNEVKPAPPLSIKPVPATSQPAIPDASSVALLVAVDDDDPWALAF